MQDILSGLEGLKVTVAKSWKTTHKLVDSESLLQECLQDIGANLPRLAIDLEGNDLGRQGTLSLIQIYPENGKTVWLVDVTVLGKKAFDTATFDNNLTLKQILEGSQVKLVFDVRTDSNALFHHYGVKLDGIYDVQLLDLAKRATQGRNVQRLNGLKASLQYNVELPRDWEKVKNEGFKLFASRSGGCGEIWDIRPLDPRLLEYASQDATLLFELYEALHSKLPRSTRAKWDSRIISESARRCAVGQTYGFNSGDRNNCFSPRMGDW